MPQRQVAAGGSVTFQPVQNQSFQHQLGIGQMAGTILLKGFKEFGVEAIGSLNGQGPVGALGGLYWVVSFGHNEQSLQGRRSLGKLCIRPCHAKVKMSAWVHCTPFHRAGLRLVLVGLATTPCDGIGRVACVAVPQATITAAYRSRPFYEGGELQVAPPATEACGLCHGRQQPRGPRHISV